MCQKVHLVRFVEIDENSAKIVQKCNNKEMFILNILILDHSKRPLVSRLVYFLFN